ncbi:hypothetical protein MMIN_32240 [Mycolicibacter minnesotensis]|nr:hypothetical protein MMIN_32240 [Mycolicibacter minnesotensis]
MFAGMTHQGAFGGLAIGGCDAGGQLVEGGDDGLDVVITDTAVLDSSGDFGKVRRGRGAGQVAPRPYSGRDAEPAPNLRPSDAQARPQ